MSKKDIKPYLIAVAALFIASAAFLLCAYNNMLIQELYLKITRLQDMDITITDVLVKANDVIQELANQEILIWDTIQDILKIIGTLISYH